MVLRIFVSYRRSDSQAISDRIHEHLIEVFGTGNVFLDVLGIKYGLDFRKVLQQRVSESDVLLIIIGSQWADVQAIDEDTGQPTGHTRLSDPNDFVRIEVETGLARDDVLVIPVLVEDAKMPQRRQLPESLHSLTYLQAILVRNNPYFDDDVARLISRLKDYEQEARQGGSRVSLSAPTRWIAIVSALLILVSLTIFIVTQFATPQPIETPMPNSSITESPVTSTASPSNTLVPTSTLLPTLTPTREPLPTATDVAAVIVKSNADWKTNITRTFNGIEMVLVPIGCFMMGSNETRNNASPVNEQCISRPFWIQKAEVTNAGYKQCVNAGWCYPPTNQIDYDNPAYSAYPVVFVSWVQASVYAQWLGSDYKLPSELEWEYAARGPDNLVFAWGNVFDASRLNFCDSICSNSWHDPNHNDGFAKSSPVGTFPAGVSWVGALDMNGNVWEWTRSLVGDYPYQANDARENTFDQINPRILRGGSWSDYPGNVHSSYRLNYPPSTGDNFLLGFRVMRIYHADDLN